MEMEKRNTDKNDDNPCGGCSTNPIRRLQCGISEEGMSYLKLEAWRWEWEGERAVGCHTFGDEVGVTSSDKFGVTEHSYNTTCPSVCRCGRPWSYWLHSYKCASTATGQVNSSSYHHHLPCPLPHWLVVLKHNKYVGILSIAVTTLQYITISMITIFSMYIVHVR